jgi:hypothetical protein
MARRGAALETDSIPICWSDYKHPHDAWNEIISKRTSLEGEEGITMKGWAENIPFGAPRTVYNFLYPCWGHDILSPKGYNLLSHRGIGSSMLSMYDTVIPRHRLV